MLKHLTVKNYKSINRLNLDLGRVNVFIGENGCGKSNILEALALVGAAEANKLDNEFLSSRGIRVTSPTLMRSRFSDSNIDKPIEISVNFSSNANPHVYKLKNDNEPYSKWTSSSGERISLTKLEITELATALNDLKDKSDESFEIDEIDPKSIKSLFESYFKERMTFLKDESSDEKINLKDFIIFSPENTALRNFYQEGQIEPLGINGEGLLKLLKVINDKKSDQIDVIKKSLKLFGWFKSVTIPNELCEQDDKIVINDKYLESAKFDQRSANEGFLFILFYMALIVSNETPKIFAVDNIDASLNPKMCTKIIKDIALLTKKYDKQVFLTTHNPAILDGLDLNDPEQKLFVVSRTRSGSTRVKEITIDSKPRSSSDEDLKLSEAMLRGYLGGLPKGF
ncbi:AAA family ATPase [Vibrio tasmaniensis]|uniref:AAA family ATPase n=1 Tax=Vibrio tasmaniensis TaxID=212663 RepID=UPI00111B809A|nr:AAA family ATPase [Vibrio tasmaniensis]